MLCMLILYISGGTDLQFKVDSGWQYFDVNSIYTQSFCQKSTERKTPKKYFLYFVLMSGL